MTESSAQVSKPRIEGKASAFASGVSKKLRAQGYVVTNLRGRAGNVMPDVYIKALAEKSYGLSTCAVKLAMPHDGILRQKDITALRLLLMELGYSIVDKLSVSATIVVTSKTVQIIEVPSSDRTKPDYVVRMENGVAVLCGCKGFAYRLDCRHTAVARSLANKATRRQAG